MRQGSTAAFQIPLPMQRPFKMSLVWIGMLQGCFLRKENAMPTPSQVSSLSRSSSSMPTNVPMPDHSLPCLVLHLLPGRLPGLTQHELMDRIHQALHMTQVRPPVLSAVLERLERAEQIASTGEGRERRYWRLGPAPCPSKPDFYTQITNGAE